ncbi:MAG: sterol carrier protein domain-containing protein [Deltaproteobacteria bacterium]|nr:sterol carrier protein domain-containing protein [Deltaproteobacteria bacterium]
MRPYNHKRDLAAVHAIWDEIGWLHDCQNGKKGMKRFLRETVGIVEESDGRIEGHVGIRDGLLLHEGRWLPFSMVATVTSSLVYRVGGFATRATAAAVADAAERGAAASGLGMFDQGFYDRLGFGTGAPDHRVSLDPRTLRVPRLTRRAKRYGLQDIDRIQACKMASRRGHGATVFEGGGDTEAEMRWYDGAYVLGFEDDDGVLTHCFSGVRKEEAGPDRIKWMAWQSREQLIELLSLLKSMADSLYGVRIGDPPGVCLLDLVDRPFESAEKRAKGAYHQPALSTAWEQWRILDPRAAFAGVRAAGSTALTISLTDPIEQHLAAGRPWRGLTGPWTLRLGDSSSMEKGALAGAPVLTASVNALSRWWLGVRPASHLALTDDFDADDGLIEELDRCWRPPPPRNDWEF